MGRKKEVTKMMKEIEERDKEPDPILYRVFFKVMDDLDYADIECHWPEMHPDGSLHLLNWKENVVACFRNWEYFYEIVKCKTEILI
jgi:hypothetical protein